VFVQRFWQACFFAGVRRVRVCRSAVSYDCRAWRIYGASADSFFSFVIGSFFLGQFRELAFARSVFEKSGGSSRWFLRSVVPATVDGHPPDVYGFSILNARCI